MTRPITAEVARERWEFMARWAIRHYYGQLVGRYTPPEGLDARAMGHYTASLTRALRNAERRQKAVTP